MTQVRICFRFYVKTLIKTTELEVERRKTRRKRTKETERVREKCLAESQRGKTSERESSRQHGVTREINLARDKQGRFPKQLHSKFEKKWRETFRNKMLPSVGNRFIAEAGEKNSRHGSNGNR